MRVVYKYPLYQVTNQSVPMPVGFEIMRIAWQHGQPMLWAIVDPEARVESVRLRIFATGEEWDETEAVGRLAYVGTYEEDRTPAAPYVWHVFRVLPLVAPTLTDADRLRA